MIFVNHIPENKRMVAPLKKLSATVLQVKYLIAPNFKKIKNLYLSGPESLQVRDPWKYEEVKPG